MKTTLTPGEMMMAGIVGVRRTLVAMANGYTHRIELETTKLSQFDSDIVGAMAELAAAKATNMYWAAGNGKVGGVDVGSEGEGFEVRCRRIGGSGLDLAFRPTDKSPRPYVLVHANPPDFFMMGWLYLHEAEDAGTVNPATGLIYVRPDKLHDMVELLR